MAWEDLTDDQKETEIFRALMLNEVGIVDQSFTARYIDAKSNTTDDADLMRLDIAFSDKVLELRNAGKISTAETLRAEAKSMTHMSSDEMRKALHEHEIEV